jgi:hypothetical protein
MREDNDLDFLLTAASWQDSLLQSYRSLHLTFQSITLAIGVGIFIATVSFDLGPRPIAGAIVLVIVWLLQLFATSRFRGVVLARGKDVNFWHKRIILAEQNLPGERRHFTRFKIHQKLERADSMHLEELFLSERKTKPDDIDVLIEKGLGHTRKVLDEQLFNGISAIWVVMIVMTLVALLGRLILAMAWHI